MYRGHPTRGGSGEGSAVGRGEVRWYRHPREQRQRDQSDWHLRHEHEEI